MLTEETMTDTKKNLYLFILWQNGRVKEKEFLEEIKNKFEIFQIYEISWREEDFAPSLARFYGKKLPKGCKKEKDTGRGPFLAILFFDNNEEWNEAGNNITVQYAKRIYREFLGGNLLHASDNPVETNENTLFLLGKNLNELLSEPASETPKIYNKGLVGFPCWKDLSEALTLIRKCPDTTVDTTKKKPVIYTKHIDVIRRLLNAEKCFLFSRYKIQTENGKATLCIKKIR